MLGAFSNKGCKKSSRKIPLEAIIHNLETHAFRSRNAKQERIDNKISHAGTGP